MTNEQKVKRLFPDATIKDNVGTFSVFFGDHVCISKSKNRAWRMAIDTIEENKKIEAIKEDVLSMFPSAKMANILSSASRSSRYNFSIVLNSQKSTKVSSTRIAAWRYALDEVKQVSKSIVLEKFKDAKCEQVGECYYVLHSEFKTPIEPSENEIDAWFNCWKLNCKTI